eukprot:6782459-Prymnesium_polylepis.1
MPRGRRAPPRALRSRPPRRPITPARRGTPRSVRRQSAPSHRPPSHCWRQTTRRWPPCGASTGMATASIALAAISGARRPTSAP